MMNNEGETMTTEEIPERQKPAIRKSTVIQDSSASPRVRKTAVKKAVVKKKVGDIPAESKKKKRGSLKVILLMILSALISSGSTYAVISNTSAASEVAVPAAAASTFTEVIAGKVALTEAELIAAVKQLGVDVYWAGPVNGAKYTLAVPADGQAYVRYLPEGQGIEDTKPNYVVIATYTTTDAFTATQAAGNTSNGVSFISAAGAAIYYSKDNPTNVYVAYPNLNYQIEIFNPIAVTALEIATTSGALKLVR
jgi:hypothetical protein